MADTNEDTWVRVYVRDGNGRDHDHGEDYGLESFAGIIPQIGDTIVVPGVPSNLDRNDATSREIWKVVERVFNPRDLQNAVVLIVETSKGRAEDTWIAGG